MSDLPKCLLCGCEPEHVEKDNAVFCGNKGCTMFMFDATPDEWRTLMGRGGEAVAVVKQNATGQISMITPSGDYFDVSKHVGQTFFTQPAPAVDDADLRHAVLTAWIYGYEKGHDDTVESRYGCIEEQAKDYVEDQFGEG